MTMVASGPVSLAGTATVSGANQSIEKELGGTGSTQISMDDAAVRALLAVASGAIAFGTAHGKAAFSPHNDDFTSAGSGSVLVSSGAVQLVMEVWGGSGPGGHGATGGLDHQGSGGSAPGYGKSVFALVAGDWGKTVSYVVGAAGVASSTSGSALDAGSVAITANPGVAGVNATGTTNGTAVTGGTAAGGNTTNATGATSTAGNSGGTAGQGGAANNGYGAGGQGGFSVSDTGRTAGLAGRVKFSWT